MKIAYMHYHLKTGGVTTVLNQQLLAGAGQTERAGDGESPALPTGEYLPRAANRTGAAQRPLSRLGRLAAVTGPRVRILTRRGRVPQGRGESGWYRDRPVTPTGRSPRCSARACGNPGQ